MEEKINIAPRIIAIDETEYYTIDSSDAPFIEGIYGVYLYDKNSHTYCCSLTPTYFLVHLETQVRLSEFAEIVNLNEYEREEIRDKYESPSDDMYVSIYTIDSLEKKLTNIPYRYVIETEEEIPEDMTYDEVFEEIREDCQCNCRL